jgi:hypothetical protein
LPGSSARNAAAGSTSTSDQRGFPIVGAPDIGAYETGTLDPNYNAYIWETLPTAGSGTFGDPLHAPNYDFDGDGVTNEAEWIMGSNAAQAVFGAAPGGVSVLVIVLASQQSDVLLGSILNRAPGRTYTLQHSDTLVSGSWVNVPGLNPLYGQGTDTWSIPISGADRRFYRVVVTKD